MDSPFVGGAPISPFFGQPPTSPFVDAPPLYTADFAFTVIFAVISFGQLVLALLLTGIKMVRRPSGANASGTVTEHEVRLLRRHRARYALLMALSLISLIMVYSTQATLTFYSFIPYLMYPNIYLANNFFWDIQNVFLSAVLIALLDSGIKMSQLRRDGSTANASQGGTNVNIVVMICWVVFLVFLTIARIVVLNLWNVELTSLNVLSGEIAWVEWWAQFDLDQVRIGADLVIAIYYTVVAIVMWRKVRLVSSGPDEADTNYSFRVLKRISIILCPMLLLSTVSIIIFDVLINVIVTFDNYWPFIFADDFTSGLIAVLLNSAIVSLELHQVKDKYGHF